MRQHVAPIATLLLIFAASACTILNTSDSEKQIREFISAFESSLSGDDDTILDFFSSAQTNQSILAAIRVLQNKDSVGVKCVAWFDNARIIHDASGIKVLVHTELSAETQGFSGSDTTSITFYLKPVKGKLTIGQMAAEDFYGRYLVMKSQAVFAAKPQATGGGTVADYAADITFLQQTYDTVVWVMKYEDELYYYVVNGTWSSERTGSYKMGLVNKTGRVIIPVDFDLVCTPSISMNRLVEVRKGGLTGLFSMEGEKLLDPEFDFIVPRTSGNVYALVKKGDEYGSVDQNNVVRMGISKEETNYVKDYSYLESITLSGQAQNYCEVPSNDLIGAGIIMPPSFLVANNLLEEVMSDFAVNPELYHANTESITASYSFMESVLGKMNAIVSVIEESYLEGRESFYRRNKIDFLDENGNVLATSNGEIYGTMDFKQIDSTLLEIRATRSGDDMDMMYMGMPENESEIDIPMYHYFVVTEGTPQRQTSNRVYNFTEFVKLDDSYITGSFRYFDHQTNGFETRSELRDSTLMEMRNEILAAYGYIFDDEATSEHFRYFKWYQPRYNTVESLLPNLSEVDAYNLQYLEKKLGPIRKDPT